MVLDDVASSTGLFRSWLRRLCTKCLSTKCDAVLMAGSLPQPVNSVSYLFVQTDLGSVYAVKSIFVWTISEITTVGRWRQGNRIYRHRQSTLFSSSSWCPFIRFSKDCSPYDFSPLWVDWLSVWWRLASQLGSRNFARMLHIMNLCRAPDSAEHISYLCLFHSSSIIGLIWCLMMLLQALDFFVLGLGDSARNVYLWWWCCAEPLVLSHSGLWRCAPFVFVCVGLLLVCTICEIISVGRWRQGNRIYRHMQSTLFSSSSWCPFICFSKDYSP